MGKEVIIGNVSLGVKPVVLAPMAGTSSVTYRGICHEFGATYAPTELCSARSIFYNGVEKSFRFLEINPDTEGITCIQLFGNEPADFVSAIDKIHEHPLLSKVSFIDINMGCPVSKVVKTGAGSALMNTPQIAADIVKASVEAASKYGKGITVKTRIGFKEFSCKSIEFVEGLCDAGASMICVHGRTQSQLYSGKADIDAIAELSAAVRSKGKYFFSNGDINSLETAEYMYEKTSCDGIMVGRAAMGNPWIFRNIKDGIKYEPTFEERISVLLRELKGTSSHIGEVTAVKEMRSVMPHYIKGLHGSTKLKVQLCQCSTIHEVEEVLSIALEGWNNNGTI